MKLAVASKEAEKNVLSSSKGSEIEGKIVTLMSVVMKQMSSLSLSKYWEVLHLPLFYIAKQMCVLDRQTKVTLRLC